MIDFGREGPVWVATINRPDKANSLTPEMLERLLSWLRGNRRLWDPRVGPSGRGAGH
mgnify:FL=1